MIDKWSLLLIYTSFFILVITDIRNNFYIFVHTAYDSFNYFKLNFLNDFSMLNNIYHF